MPFQQKYSEHSKQITSPRVNLHVKIWRGKDKGKLHSYQVPMRENQTVLDIVTEVQRRHEPSLAYRFACRVGVCGSCAMTVNGIPRWTCRSHVKDVINNTTKDDSTLIVEPLRNLPKIKDLVCDFTPFFEKWQCAGGRFTAPGSRHHQTANIDPNNKARAEANAAIECINCAVCYSACDVVAWDKNYLGPAALNRAWTLINDVRHRDRAGTLRKTLHSGGCTSCHSQGNCTRYCPVEISPSESIASLKRAALFGLPDAN